MRRPKSSFSTSKKSAGKKPSNPTNVTTASPHTVWMSRQDLVGAIASTTFFDDTHNTRSEVAVLGYAENCPCPTGVLVKVQRWDGTKMYGGTLELDLAWLQYAEGRWFDAPQPFDDDIPF